MKTTIFCILLGIMCLLGKPIKSVKEIKTTTIDTIGWVIMPYNQSYPITKKTDYYE